MIDNQPEIKDNPMVVAITDLGRNFEVFFKPVNIVQGPSTVTVEVLPIGKTKVRDITALEDELTVHLAAKSVRINVMPGRGTIGIEISSGAQDIVPFEYTPQPDMKLPIYMGMDTTGNKIFKDLASMVHLLAAGSSGTGKSVFINTLICSILSSKQHVKFVMIDPKKVELSTYKDLGPDWFFNGQGPGSTNTARWACR